MKVIRGIEGTIYEENKIIGTVEQIARLGADQSLFKKLCRCGICPVVITQVLRKHKK